MNSGQNGSILVTAIPGNGSNFATEKSGHETPKNSGQNVSNVAPSVTVLGSSMNSGQSGSINVTSIPGNGSDFATATQGHETPINSGRNGSSVAPSVTVLQIIDEFWSKRKYICMTAIPGNGSDFATTTQEVTMKHR